MDISANKRQLIAEHYAAFNAKCENIKWVLGGLVGQTVLMYRPDIIDVSKLPNEIFLSDLRMATGDVFGVVLSPKDRQIVGDELLSAARRLLIADSLDQLIESVCRSWGVHRDAQGRDPYKGGDEITYTGKKLYGGRGAATLLQKEERQFIEKLAWPLRNAIRHNNGVLPPGKADLNYAGIVAGIKIQAKLVRGQPLNASLDLAFNFFKIIRGVGSSAFDKLLAKYAS